MPKGFPIEMVYTLKAEENEQSDRYYLETRDGILKQEKKLKNKKMLFIYSHFT